MRLISVNICLILVIQLLGCSSPQKADSLNSTSDNKPVNLSKSRIKIENPSGYAEEKFAEEWKSKYEETIAKLENNRRLWQGSQMLNYDFVVQRCCGGFTDYWSPALIKVRNGELDSMEFDSTRYLKIDSYENFDTIDKFFDYIRHELDKGRIIKPVYNTQFGYPEDVTIVYRMGVTHGSNNIKISKFEIIK